MDAELSESKVQNYGFGGSKDLARRAEVFPSVCARLVFRTGFGDCVALTGCGVIQGVPCSHSPVCGGAYARRKNAFRDVWQNVMAGTVPPKEK